MKMLSLDVSIPTETLVDGDGHSEVSSLSPSRRASLESLTEQKTTPRAPGAHQRELIGRYHHRQDRGEDAAAMMESPQPQPDQDVLEGLETADTLEEDIHSQVSAPVPSTPEPRSVTMLRLDINDKSVADSLGSGFELEDGSLVL